MEEPQPARLSPRPRPSQLEGSSRGENNKTDVMRPENCVLAGRGGCRRLESTGQFARCFRTCVSPTAFTYFNYPLAHIAERVTKAQPIKVVAIGSSSTAGAGASSSTATYPSRLSIYLQERFPRNSITVLNRGVNGDEAVNMVVRFERDVIDEHPDLVLWQIGTNVVLRDHPLDSAGDAFARGVEKVKSCGADVILINPQFAPKVLEKTAINMMIDLISNTAEMDR